MQKNVLEYLENSVKTNPNKIAFANQDKEYTYETFSKKAKSIAVKITEKVDRINKPIIVFVDRNVESLVGFMATLYSANYYVPIDVKMPKQRMEKIIEQVKPVAALYVAEQEECVCEVVNENIAKIRIDEESNLEITKEQEEKLNARRNKILDVDPVYIIFTSGSTGTPKGIVISHRSVIDFTDWMAETFKFNEKDIMANQAPFYFDLSVKDIYTTLKCSATTYIIPRKVLMFPTLVVDFLNEKKATALIWATSAFHLVSNSKVFDKKKLTTAQKVILGGEALQAKQLNIWKRAMPNITYVNLYGPTEVTVDCTYYIIDREYKDDEAIPIGRACENKEVMLLDEEMKEVPVGIPGEICVRGTGLAKGYYGDEEKTNQVFVQNPLHSNYPDIIYKTGDIGIKNEEGLIIFQSRKDGQIKHMGYRIELGEIERAVNSIAKVNASICFYDESVQKIVCVYEGEIEDAEIIKEVQDILPKYMYPNILKKIEQMLYNANGKIDRVKIKEKYFLEK